MLVVIQCRRVTGHRFLGLAFPIFQQHIIMTPGPNRGNNATGEHPPTKPASSPHRRHVGKTMRSGMHSALPMFNAEGSHPWLSSSCNNNRLIFLSFSLPSCFTQISVYITVIGWIRYTASFSLLERLSKSLLLSIKTEATAQCRH